MLRLMAAKLSRHWPSRQACASPLVLMSSSQVSGMIACEPRRPADSTSWPSRAKSRKVAQKPPVQRGAPLGSSVMKASPLAPIGFHSRVLTRLAKLRPVARSIAQPSRSVLDET